MLKEEYKRRLSQATWFAPIPADLQTLVFENMRCRHFEAGHLLHGKGDEGVGFYGVCEGRIRVMNSGNDGKALLLALLGPGTWFGEISLFDDLPRTHDSYCDVDTWVGVIPKTAFKRMLDTHPQLYPYFARLLCSRVRSAFQFIDSSAGLNLKQQLVKRLLMLSSSFGQYQPTQNTAVLRLSQESLAQMINSSRQTVNQLLKGLQAEGFIHVHYGKITVMDMNGMFALLNE